MTSADSMTSTDAIPTISNPIVLTNTSPEPRRHWATVKMPPPGFSAIEMKTPWDLHCENGEVFPATAAVSWTGRHLLHVQAKAGGSHTFRGKLAPSSRTPEPFQFHPWVVDDIAKLLVELGVQIVPGDEIHWSTVDQILELESSAARKRWWMRARIRPLGLILEFWLDIYSKDCVGPFHGKIVWSNRNDSAWNKVFPTLWIRCGEALAFNFKKRHGIVGNDKDSTGRYRYLIGQNVPFCDGAALPLSGSMLCFRDRMDSMTDAERDQSVQNIRAAAHDEAAMFGACLDREGDWLSLKHVPRVSASDLAAADSNRWAGFVASLESTAGFFVKRELGISPTPGQTGSQEDFGATKGTLVLHGYPRHLMRMRYSVQADCFRGFNHYESNGSPITVAMHPNWVTWSGITHYHSGVSPDRLGKEAPQEPANGWRGYDDQHRSQNNLAAYLELVDDPLMLDQTFHILTSDQANYRRKYPNNGPDAARGQGRCVQAYTNLYVATGDKNWTALVAAQAKQSIDFMRWLGNGPMRVLSTNGPDGRVPVFVDGVLVPTVSLWEHALALVGFRSAQLALPSQDVTDVVEGVSRLLLEHCLHGMPGNYQLVTSVHWNNGDTPQGVLFDNGSGVGGWINAGLRVAIEVLPRHPMTITVRDYLGTVVQEPDRRIDWAEWWAATKENP